MIQSYESKRRVRVLHEHTATEDDHWGGFHEWVERAADVNDCEMLDAIGRRYNNGWLRWDYWICNNSDCGALAPVCAVQVEEVVTGWLNEVAPAVEPGSEEDQSNA